MAGDAQRLVLALAWLSGGCLAWGLGCELGYQPDLPGDSLAACGDGQDDDGDGLTDFPADPGCQSPQDPAEGDPRVRPACSDGLDNDGDGRTDFDTDHDGQLDAPEDPGCESAADDDEANLILPECNDRVDNDGDGLTDLGDPNCLNRNDVSETPECADGQDNDLDGLTDFPGDPQCLDADDDSESGS